MSSKMKSEKLYVCTSKGPQNNGKVKKCIFSEMLPSDFESDTYHCPICAAPLAEADELDNQ